MLVDRVHDQRRAGLFILIGVLAALILAVGVVRSGPVGSQPGIDEYDPLTPARLLDTEYGRMLLVKLILVGAVLGLGALNKLRMVPALGAGKPRAAHAFRTVLRIEAAGFVAVFLATALLTSATTLPGH